MIPIECPKCGRGGSLPLDRLNARLVCKGCQTVFHLDNTGRIILGEPGSSEQGNGRAKQASVSEFDLAQTWNDIPKPVRFGVPAVLLAVIGYFYLGPGDSGPGYISKSKAVIRALASNDRSRVVSYASSDSTESAGKWFDLMHGELEKCKVPPDVLVSPSLLRGNPERDSEISLLIVLAGTGESSKRVTINLPMRRDGSTWTFNGNKSLENAEREAGDSKKSH